MTEREAYIALNLVSGIGPIRVNQLLSVLGSPQAILTSSRDQLARVAGVGADLAERIASPDHAAAVEQEMDIVERGGATVVTRVDEAFPNQLLELRDPPLCLYVRGSLDALRTMNHAVAIVGSRRTTRYGTRMAEHLAGAAAFGGWTVVAGLARGIDSVAHEATLEAGGCTVAVLGSGLGRVYPRENIDLARRMVDAGGALVSEFPMLFPPDKRTFPMRNRIIAGMTRGTIVVEAGFKSGSLITATQALEQGRQVFAVPGPVDSPQSRGCHQLIKDGANLAETFADVVDGLTLLFHETPRARPRDSETPPPDEPGRLDLPDLDGLQRRIYDSIGTDDVSVDELIGELNEPSAKVLSAVIQLEMRRVIRQLPGKRVCRADNARIG